jgi:Plasma-membrane choline transporter
MKMIEKLLQYLIRNAYIIVAKDGTPLVTSGRKAVELLARQIINVVILNKVGDFVLFVGKLFIVLISTFVGYEFVMVR